MDARAGSCVIADKTGFYRSSLSATKAFARRARPRRIKPLPANERENMGKGKHRREEINR